MTIQPPGFYRFAYTIHAVNDAGDASDFKFKGVVSAVCTALEDFGTRAASASRAPFAGDLPPARSAPRTSGPQTLISPEVPEPTTVHCGGTSQTSCATYSAGCEALGMHAVCVPATLPGGGTNGKYCICEL